MSKEDNSDGIKIADLARLLADHGKRISILENKKNPLKIESDTVWYKPDSTTALIVNLVEEGFFKKPQSMRDIISELKTRDYTRKPSELTPSLRQIVRKNLLKRTRSFTDGTKSKKWLYIEIWGK